MFPFPLPFPFFVVVGGGEGVVAPGPGFGPGPGAGPGVGSCCNLGSGIIFRNDFCSLLETYFWVQQVKSLTFFFCAIINKPEINFQSLDHEKKGLTH